MEGNCHRIGPEALGYRWDERWRKKRQPQSPFRSSTRLIKNEIFVLCKNRTRHHVTLSFVRLSRDKPKVAWSKMLYRGVAKLKHFYQFRSVLLPFTFSFPARSLLARAHAQTADRKDEAKRNQTHQGEVNTNTINKWRRNETRGVRNVLKSRLFVVFSGPRGRSVAT